MQQIRFVAHITKIVLCWMSFFYFYVIELYPHNTWLLTLLYSCHSCKLFSNCRKCTHHPQPLIYYHSLVMINSWQRANKNSTTSTFLAMDSAIHSGSNFLIHWPLYGIVTHWDVKYKECNILTRPLWFLILTCVLPLWVTWALRVLILHKISLVGFCIFFSFW